MAGDWIKMRADLHDDPAVFRLAGMLQLDRFSVVGRLHAFWSWADKHSVDGRVDGATTHLVDTVATQPGFADALLVVGWLEHDDKGIVIPNFQRHNGKTAKERALKNQRQTRWRTKDGAVDGGVDGPVDAKPSTREEKRRVIKQEAPPSGGPIWSECLTILRDQGHSENAARAFLGMLCRDYAETDIVEAVKASIGKANAAAYIRGVLRSSRKKSDTPRMVI